MHNMKIEDEENEILEAVADAGKRSVPLIILQAIHDNTRITKTIEETQVGIQRELNRMNLSMAELVGRVVALEQWRGTAAKIGWAAFTVAVTVIASALLPFLQSVLTSRPHGP